MCLSCVSSYEIIQCYNCLLISVPELVEHNVLNVENVALKHLYLTERKQKVLEIHMLL